MKNKVEILIWLQDKESYAREQKEQAAKDKSGSENYWNGAMLMASDAINKIRETK